MPERYSVNSRVFLCLTFLLLVFPGGWVVSVPYVKIHKQFDVVVKGPVTLRRLAPTYADV